MSHNHQITKFKEKGSQYSGKTSHDDFYVQLLMWLKYATTHSQSVYWENEGERVVTELSAVERIEMLEDTINFLLGL